MRTLVAILLLTAAPNAWADCNDTGFEPGNGDDDCDEDGWSKKDNDCDDNDPEINPGEEGDDCGDFKDNDCNGFFDDGCERPNVRGSLLGGNTCGAASTSTASVLVLPFLALLRRRRS